MPIYGKEALNICHPYMTDIQRYTEMTIFGSECRFSFIACLAAILKSEVVLAVFSGNFNSLEETFHDLMFSKSQQCLLQLTEIPRG